MTFPAPRTSFAVRRRPSAFSIAALFVLATSGCSCSSSSSAAAAGSDHFLLTLNGASYEYQCAASDDAGVRNPTILTRGCNWPATNPYLEIDISVVSSKPIKNAYMQLSDPATAAVVQVTVGLFQSSARDHSSIYASWVPGPTPTVAPGTGGGVTINSYDPTTGKLDIRISNMGLPVTQPSDYPNAPSTIGLGVDIVR